MFVTVSVTCGLSCITVKKSPVLLFTVCFVYAVTVFFFSLYFCLFSLTHYCKQSIGFAVEQISVYINTTLLCLVHGLLRHCFAFNVLFVYCFVYNIYKYFERTLDVASFSSLKLRIGGCSSCFFVLFKFLLSVCCCLSTRKCQKLSCVSIAAGLFLFLFRGFCVCVQHTQPS